MRTTFTSTTRIGKREFKR